MIYIIGKTGYIGLLTDVTEYIYSPRGNLYCFEEKRREPPA